MQLSGQLWEFKDIHAQGHLPNYRDHKSLPGFWTSWGMSSRRKADRLSNTSFSTRGPGPEEYAEHGRCAVTIGLRELKHGIRLTHPATDRTAKPHHLRPPTWGATGKLAGWRKGCCGEWTPKEGAGPGVLPASGPAAARAWKETRHPGAAPVQFLPQRRKRRARGRTVPTIFSTSYQNSLVNSLKSHRSECDIKYIPYISYVSLFYY